MCLISHYPPTEEAPSTYIQYKKKTAAIKGLTPDTTYEITVVATNMVGSSFESAVVTVTTLEEIPTGAIRYNV